MTNQELKQELFIAGKQLYKALVILFKIYKPYIKALLITLIAYLAFKLGRKTIVDPLQENVTNLQSKVKNRSYYILQVPQKIETVKKLKILFIIIFILFLVGVLLMLHFKVKFMKKVTKSLLIQIGTVMLISIIVSWTYQRWLKNSQTKGRNDDLTINQQLYATTKQMGPKAQGLLRTFLCKQKQLNKIRKPTGVCYKQKCKQQRKLAKDRSNLFEGLVQSGLSFQWCSICKTKLPYQEFLQFQSHRYQKQQGCDQSVEVDKKNEYLITELSRMSAWIRGVSPCNCSRLYWTQQLKHIKNFKLAEKELEIKEQLMRRKSYIVRK